MKPVLIVEGKELEVTNIRFVDGEVRSVQVHLGENLFDTYEDKNSLFAELAENAIDLKQSLKFKNENDELINHLEECIRTENDSLVEIAIEAMENKTELPFNTHLVDMQKEYQLAQKKLMGFIDAVEEVKAFTEGYYADKNNDESIEKKKHHQSIK